MRLLRTSGLCWTDLRCYIYSLGIAIDQFVNALFAGYPDDTVSYRAAKARNKGKRWGCVLCKVLDAIHTDHCHIALVSKFISLKKRGVI